MTRPLCVVVASLLLLAAGEQHQQHQQADPEVEKVRSAARSDLDAGKARNARAKLKGALAKLRASASGPTMDAANLLNDLGQVYTDLGQEIEAIASLEEASDIFRQLYGPSDPRYGLAIDRLADAHTVAGPSLRRCSFKQSSATGNG